MHSPASAELSASWGNAGRDRRAALENDVYPQIPSTLRREVDGIDGYALVPRPKSTGLENGIPRSGILLGGRMPCVRKGQDAVCYLVFIAFALLQAL